MHERPKIESRLFPDDGETPNNPVLPLVIMHLSEAAAGPDAASWFEKRFEENGWGSTWRWTVYPYQHFHTTNHEVLGVSRGAATLMLGGARGAEFHVRKGDVIIIPAGVGHKRLEASGDFQVVGGYPDGKEPDLIRPGEEPVESCLDRITRVPMPRMDPVFGTSGFLFEHWKA